jgi:hypothetical protein
MKKFFWCTLALAAGLAATVGAAGQGRSAIEGSPISITGCVAASDSGSFVLTHVQKASEPGQSTTGAVLGATGMENASGEVIYWLSKDSVKRMRGHVGHRVEVTGTITDVSTGTVQVKQEPGKPGPDNKVEVDARGKSASGKTDRPVEPGPAPRLGMKTEEKTTLPVHRIKVATVKMIAPTCP